MLVALGGLGVANPAGVDSTKLVVPTASGWKIAEVDKVSEVIVTGLVTIVPMVVSELVMVTLTLRPLRIFCTAWKVRVEGLSWPTMILTVLLAELVVVLKFPVFHAMPEGVRVTLRVALL